jgi:hypothetical protein
MPTLAESLDNEGEAWKPEPGDKLVGVVTNIEIVDSKFGGKYPIVEVQNLDDGIRVFHAFHTPSPSRSFAGRSRRLASSSPSSSSATTSTATRTTGFGLTVRVSSNGTSSTSPPTTMATCTEEHEELRRRLLVEEDVEQLHLFSEPDEEDG